MPPDLLDLGSSLGYLDELYDAFQNKPDAIDASWHDLFGDGKPRGNGSSEPTASAATIDTRAATRTTRPMPTFARPGVVTMSPLAAPPSVWPIVNAYRTRGHFAANLDPLGLLETAHVAELDPGTWGFTDRQMDVVIEPTGVHGMPRATVGELLAHLRRVYSAS